MNINTKSRKQFRAIGHRLNPVVIVSNGLSDNVDKEIERALGDHELIKIRINADDREEKKELITSICESHKAELIHQAGHVALLFRAARKPKEQLSNLHRHKDLLV